MNKKIQQKNFPITVVPIFEEDETTETNGTYTAFSKEEDRRFLLVNEVEYINQISSNISPVKFRILKDSVSNRTILRMSWHNNLGVPLSNFKINIVASNGDTEWIMNDIEIDVSKNFPGLSEKWGVVLPNNSEKCLISITHIVLDDGLYIDDINEHFSFFLESKREIFLSDINGDIIVESKNKQLDNGSIKINKVVISRIAVTISVIVAVIVAITTVICYIMPGIGTIFSSKTLSGTYEGTVYFSNVEITFNDDKITIESLGDVVVCNYEIKNGQININLNEHQQDYDVEILWFEGTHTYSKHKDTISIGGINFTKAD